MSSDSIGDVKRPTVTDSNGDRISDLPDNVVDNILKRLPLHEAVRTSILSSHWRYKWYTLPDLDFDNRTFQESVLGNWDVESLIDYLLPWHEGPIVKFKFRSTSAGCNAAMDRWIHVLLDHPVECLELSWRYLGPYTDYPLLPSHLFSFDHLKDLTLENVTITPPPAFKGYSKLVNLEFRGVRIELDELQMIISKCPMLVSLKLIACKNTNLWFLEIDSPSLKFFQFSGSLHAVSSISFINASLEEITMTPFSAFETFDFGDRSYLVEVFDQLPSIKKVYLNGFFLECLAVDGVPEILPSNLNHLTLLDIDDIMLGAMDQISCALCLIKSFTNLQNLEISFSDWNIEDAAATEYLKAQQTCNVPLSHLKNVRVFGISGMECEFEFVKLILLWATVLEKLEIMTWFKSEIDAESDDDPNDQGDYNTLLKKHEILKKIASYRRASSKVALLLDKF